MTPVLGVATDFIKSTGPPEDALRAVAEAGFQCVHWVHHWNTDFLYGPSELDAIERLLREYRLSINDIHGSAGVEKNWGSPREYERLAGVDLVANRIEFGARLGGNVVVMHAPTEPGESAEAEGAAARTAFWDGFRRSLDALEPVARRAGVRLALENMTKDNFDTLGRAFAAYSPDYLGLCYDPGHGNIAGNGLDRLDRVRDRLIATHLNDNDGTADQHRPLFSATVDWARLAGIIARSGYAKPCMSMEILLAGSGFTDAPSLLQHVHATGARFDAMVAEARAARR